MGCPKNNEIWGLLNRTSPAVGGQSGTGRYESSVLIGNTGFKLIDNSAKHNGVSAKSVQDDAKYIKVYAKSILPTSCPTSVFFAYLNHVCGVGTMLGEQTSHKPQLTLYRPEYIDFVETLIYFADLSISFTPVFPIQAEFSFGAARVDRRCSFEQYTEYQTFPFTKPLPEEVCWSDSVQIMIQY